MSVSVHSNASNHCNKVIFSSFFCLLHRKETNFFGIFKPSGYATMYCVCGLVRVHENKKANTAEKKRCFHHLGEWCSIVRTATITSLTLLNGSAGNLYLNWIWIENYLDTWLSRSQNTEFNAFYYQKNAMRVKNTRFFLLLHSLDTHFMEHFFIFSFLLLFHSLASSY